MELSSHNRTWVSTMCKLSILKIEFISQNTVFRIRKKRNDSYLLLFHKGIKNYR